MCTEFHLLRFIKNCINLLKKEEKERKDEAENRYIEIYNINAIE